MHTQQGHPTTAPHIQKQDSKLIDPQRIKTILSKKLQSKTPNPQQMVQQLEDQISFQIEKTQHEIQKQRQRKNRIHLVEQRQIKARSLLNEKIQSKLEKSQKKKTTQQKKQLEDRLKARKLKEQLVQGRKQQIYQNQFKERLEKFKQIKALNDPKLQTSQQEPPKKKKASLLRHSLSERSYFTNPIEKSKELQDLKYFKKLQLLEKRKIYEKLEPKVQIPKTNDKTEWIQKLNSQSQSKYIQKLGDDLAKIEEARKKKEKQTNQKLEKIRKEAEMREQQRGYRLQILKSDINQIQKNRKQVLSKKNLRFLTVRNKSTPSLLDRNLSYASEYKDSFGGSTNGKLLGSVSKMSKTLENFNQSMSIQRAKAEDYLVKEMEKKSKKEAINVISQVLREEKTQILMQ